MVKTMENLIKMGWFGGMFHYFRKHPHRLIHGGFSSQSCQFLKGKKTNDIGFVESKACKHLYQAILLYIGTSTTTSYIHKHPIHGTFTNILSKTSTSQNTMGEKKQPDQPFLWQRSSKMLPSPRPPPFRWFGIQRLVLLSLPVEDCSCCSGQILQPAILPTNREKNQGWKFPRFEPGKIYHKEPLTPEKSYDWLENPPWMKRYFLLKMGIFQCHVSFQGCNTADGRNPANHLL